MVQLRTLRKTCTCTFYEHACLEIRSDNWKFNGRGMNFANCVGFQMRWNLREKTALGLAIFAFFIKFCNKRKRLLDLLPADLISAPCACARPRALHALRMLLLVVLSTCAGKAATRYSLGSRLTVAGRHFHLFALLSSDLVASSRLLSSSLCCQFRVLELPTLRPKTHSCSRESEVFCCDVHLRSLG